MTSLEILGLVAMGAAPLGIAVSLIATIIFTNGRSRILAAAALALGLASIALITYAEGLPYRASRTAAAWGGLAFTATLIAIYLRHTYFPSTLKYINRPATAGIVISFAALALLVSTWS